MRNSSSRNIAGIALVLFGALWFLSNLDIFYFDIWDYFWPSFFIAVGIILAVKGRALFIATLFIFFGAINLASRLMFISSDYLFSNYWPIILIALGMLILFRKKDGRRDFRYSERRESRRGRRHEFSHPFDNSQPGNGQSPEGQNDNENNRDEKTKDESGYYYSGFNDKYNYVPNQSTPVDMDRIDEVAILTSCRKFVTSQNFKGGRVTTILGGGIIDLTGAKLAEGDNVIEFTSIMGGMTFRVPQDWKVIVNVHSIFGGFEDKRRFFRQVEPKGNATLIIKGTVLMGGGTVTY